MQRDLHPKVKPEDRKKMGPPRYASRSGDKKQARHIVNLHVRFGRLPKPNTVPCFDCGHIGPGKRHEYDHYLG